MSGAFPDRLDGGNCWWLMSKATIHQARESQEMENAQVNVQMNVEMNAHDKEAMAGTEAM
jgi:hypothetical protein